MDDGRKGSETRMKICLHQVNVLFCQSIIEKIQACDAIVLMRHCQMERSNYQNRILVSPEKYLTLSVKDIKHLDTIANKEYVQPWTDWQRGKDKFPQFRNVLDLFDDCIHKNVAVNNEQMIRRQLQLMGIKADILVDFPTELKGSERLLNLCLANGSNHYLSGSSGRNYLDSSLFENAGVKVEFQDHVEINRSPLQLLHDHINGNKTGE